MFSRIHTRTPRQRQGTSQVEWKKNTRNIAWIDVERTLKWFPWRKKRQPNIEMKLHQTLTFPVEANSSEMSLCREFPCETHSENHSWIGLGLCKSTTALDWNVDCFNVSRFIDVVTWFDVEYIRPSVGHLHWCITELLFKWHHSHWAQTFSISIQPFRAHRLWLKPNERMHLIVECLERG